MKNYPLLLLLLLLCSSLPAQNGIQRMNRPASTERGGGFNPLLKPFYHGVASGDPTSTSLVIWTRLTPENAPEPVFGQYFVALDTTFANLVQTGDFTAESSNDYNVKIELDGLTEGTTYYYYFRALNANSLIGRGKTCPETSDNLKFAIVSCSNFEGGFFNAYEMIAVRNDLDAVVHLGDYIYEYGAGTYGIPLPDRINDPTTEILTLSDYRTRYSLYRLDPDLIRLHQQHTFISIWDDHESANDSYTDGAQNHQTNEGDWNTRKAISKQVYFEWMPVRNNPDNSVYRAVRYGNLCDLFMLDTRLEGRVEPPVHFDTPDVPARNIISDTQYNWLITNLKQSDAQWKILGNQVLFSTFNVGFAGGAFDGVPDPTNIDSIRAAEDLFIDNWESYPTQRNNIIDSLRLLGIDNVVITTGDSHCSWAFDVTKQAVVYPGVFNLPQANPYNPTTQAGYDPVSGNGSWAVEFGTPSVSSPNFNESVGDALTEQFEQLINKPIPSPLGSLEYNPHLKYVDLDRHGYFLLDVKADSIQADYYYVPTVAVDTTGETFGQAMVVLTEQNRLKTGTAPAAPKAVQDVPTPLLPPGVSSSVKNQDVVTVFSAYPNPTTGLVYLHLGFDRTVSTAMHVYDVSGRLVMSAQGMREYAPGVYNLTVDLGKLETGTYFISLEGSGGIFAVKKVVKQ
ncbi:MAG: alkaline phosphatase D family protein [Saprospiraceae bacterium]|nr:alkaline phosphatase D family protein [Saprospiraceae bacterium]